MKAALRKIFPANLPVWLQRLVLLMFVPVTLLLAYLLKDAIRIYVLEPILYAVRIVSLLYDILPQYIWWGGLVLILALLALRSFGRRQPLTARRKPPAEDRLSQVRAWTQSVTQASGGTFNARWLLARQVARLAVDMIAHQERMNSGQASLRLQSGQIPMPPEIRDYLLAGLGLPEQSQFADLLPMRSDHGASPLDLNPEIVVEYLENRIQTGGLL